MQLVHKIIWYWNTNGIYELVKQAHIRIFRFFFLNADILVCLDMADLHDDDARDPESMQFLRYNSVEDIPDDIVNELSSFKGGRNVFVPFIKRYLSLPQGESSLWIQILHDHVVGYSMTAKGGFCSYYGIPMTSRDAAAYNAEIFPQFRAKGLRQYCIKHMARQLKKEGITRMYGLIKEWNVISLRSAKKGHFIPVAKLHLFSMFGVHFTVCTKARGIVAYVDKLISRLDTDTQVAPKTLTTSPTMPGPDK